MRWLAAAIWLTLATAAWSQTPAVVNLGPAFKAWCQQAREATPARRLELWDALVESRGPEFYQAVVWENHPDWKKAMLQAAFPRWLANEERIEAEFEGFEARLTAAIARFGQLFPDAHFDCEVWAVPSAFGYNGQGTEIPATSQHPARAVLTFGLDVVALDGEDRDVLFSHELFHIYHSQAMGLVGGESAAENDPPLFLWMEGLATYVSSRANPSAPAQAVLMAADLARVPDSDLPWLAQTFLAELERKDFRQRWFRAGNGHPLRSDLPQRCAYLLGERVCARLAERSSLTEMAHWTPQEARTRVLETLRAMAATAPPAGGNRAGRAFP